MRELITTFLDAMNSNLMPHFKYHLDSPLSRYFGCVYIDGKIIHKIVNIDDFYREFGYTAEMMKDGVSPEEYIWITYIQNASCNFVVCLQICIIKYLIKHSTQYSQQCENLLDDYLKKTVEKGWSCSHCSMKPLCGKLRIFT